jgi:hypothetical protein
LYALDGAKRTSLPVLLSVNQNIGQALPTPSIETRYLPSTGDLIIEDLDISGSHYWVKLHDEGGFQFKVVDFHVLPGVTGRSYSQYDITLNEATLPRISAAGAYFSITLKGLANGLFSVNNVNKL